MREAVARCPDCKRFFCRECISEHDDRVLCASCLSRRLSREEKKQYGRVLHFFPLALGLLTAWLFFYWIGEGLLLLPSSFHEGTFWKNLETFR